jgi:O-antigen/teichoic acid export membrane protein
VTGARSGPRSRREVVWLVADQGFSSLSNFGVAFAGALLLTAREFGAVSVTFAIYVICIGLVRAVTSEPLAVRESRAPQHGGKEATAAVLMLSLLLGSGFSIVAAIVATSLDASAFSSALLALAITLPALIVQDQYRFVAFTYRAPEKAVLADAIWVLGSVALIAYLHLAGKLTAASLLVAWGIGAGLGALTAAVQTRAWPRGVRTALRWLATLRHMSASFLLEFLASAVVAQAVVLMMAARLGLEVAASLRMAEVLLGPVTVLGGLIATTAVPMGVRRHAADPTSFGKAYRRLLAGALALVAVYSAVLLIPSRSLWTTWLGEVGQGALAILPLYAAWRLAATAINVQLWSLRSVGAYERSRRARLVSSGIVLAVFVPVALVSQLPLVLLSLALAQTLGAVIWHLHVRQALREGFPRTP